MAKYRSLEKCPYVQSVVSHLSSRVTFLIDPCGNHKALREIDSRKVIDKSHFGKLLMLNNNTCLLFSGFIFTLFVGLLANILSVQESQSGSERIRFLRRRIHFFVIVFPFLLLLEADKCK